MESNFENEVEYLNPKSNFNGCLIEREKIGTEEEREEAKRLKEIRFKNYKEIHEKKIKAENLELDMKIERLQREKRIFEEEEKHREKNQTTDNTGINSNDIPRTSANQLPQTVYFL